MSWVHLERRYKREIWRERQKQTEIRKTAPEPAQIPAPRAINWGLVGFYGCCVLFGAWFWAELAYMVWKLMGF